MIRHVRYYLKHPQSGMFGLLQVQAIRFWIAGTLPDVEGCSES